MNLKHFTEEECFELLQDENLKNIIKVTFKNNGIHLSQEIKDQASLYNFQYATNNTEKFNSVAYFIILLKDYKINYNQLIKGEYIVRYERFKRKTFRDDIDRLLYHHIRSVEEVYKKIFKL